MTASMLMPIPFSTAMERVLGGEGYIKNYNSGVYVYFGIECHVAREAIFDNDFDFIDDEWRDHVIWWEEETNLCVRRV